MALVAGGPTPSTVDLRALGATAPSRLPRTTARARGGRPACCGRLDEAVGRLLIVEGVTLAAAALVVAAVELADPQRSHYRWTGWPKQLETLRPFPLSSGTPTLDERVPDAAPGTEIGDVSLALNDMLDHLGTSLEDELRQSGSSDSSSPTPVTSYDPAHLHQGYAELYRRTDTDRAGATTRSTASSRGQSDGLPSLTTSCCSLASTRAVPCCMSPSTCHGLPRRHRATFRCRHRTTRYRLIP